MPDTLRAMTEITLPVSMRAIAAVDPLQPESTSMVQDENLALQRRLLSLIRNVE